MPAKPSKEAKAATFSTVMTIFGLYCLVKGQSAENMLLVRLGLILAFIAEP